MFLKKMMLIGGLGLLASPAAFAQSSTTLNVTGKLIPNSCTPVFANGGTVDFGKISSADLNAATHSSRTGQGTLSITCNAGTRFGIVLKDNRAGTEVSGTGPSSQWFGLGQTTASENIGGYRLVMDQSAVLGDNGAVFIRSSGDSGTTWTQLAGTTHAIDKNRVTGFAKTSATNTGPEAITNLTAPFEVDLLIAPTNNLTTSSEITIDGSATLEVVYF